MTTPGRLFHLTGKLKHVGRGCTATYGLTKGTTVTVVVLGITPGRRPDDAEIQAMLGTAHVALATARDDFKESMAPADVPVPPKPTQKTVMTVTKISYNRDGSVKQIKKRTS